MRNGMIRRHGWRTCLFTVLCALALGLMGFGGAAQTSATEPQSVGRVENLTAATQGQGAGAVQLNWTVAADAQTHFVVYLKSADRAAGNYGTIRMAPFAGSAGVVRGLEGGTSYDFIAIGMRWNWIQFGTVWGEWSGWASATPTGSGSAVGGQLPATEPQTVGRVENLATTIQGQGVGSVKVSWTAAADAQTHFVVYLKSADRAAGDYGMIRMAPFAGAEGVIRGLEAGTSYDFIAIGMRWNWIQFGTVWGAWSGWASGVPSATGVDLPESAADRAALVALYNATDGANWTDNTNWLSDGHVGEWHGVTTDASGRVTELDLRESQLIGMLPVSLGNLSNLEVLNLSNNQLRGQIPSSLSRLFNLTELYLGGNQLTGSIPTWLDNLTNLEDLVLSDNRFSGSIPSQLGNLSNLARISLRSNRLSKPDRSRLNWGT